MINKNLLFGIPIYHTRVDPNKYNKQSIINKINQNYFVDNKRNLFDNHSNLHHSYNDTDNSKFEDIDYEQSGLNNVYNNIFEDFVNQSLKTKDKFFYEYTLENYTATKESQFMRPHNHLPNSDFSTVHYLQFDEKNHSRTNFLNPNDFAAFANYIRKDYINVCNNKHFDNSYLFEYWEYNVKEDDMIIFPSFLKHEIPKQKNNVDKLRITIVCNLKIKEA